MGIFRKEGSVKIQRVNPNREAERLARRKAKKYATDEERAARMARKSTWRKARNHPKYGGSRAYRLLALS